MKKYFSPLTAETASTKTTEPIFKPANIQEELKYGRALNAVLWGMPAVNTELLYQGMKNSKGDFNQVVYWSKLASWKNH